MSVKQLSFQEEFNSNPMPTTLLSLLSFCLFEEMDDVYSAEKNYILHTLKTITQNVEKDEKKMFKLLVHFP